jgi:hypothetical protein
MTTARQNGDAAASGASSQMWKADVCENGVKDSRELAVTSSGLEARLRQSGHDRLGIAESSFGNAPAELW